MICIVRFLTFSFVMYASCDKGTGTLSDNLVDDLDIYRNVNELITYNGYPLEEHCVLTPDGYFLSVKRIPHGRKNSMEDNKKGVALLVHGILADSTIWVYKSPDRSLGFILPDEGYDVWLLNTRGSNYSKKHIKYKTDQRKFWDFSFDEMAQYDIPATIDYILKSTSEKSLYLIGHSQGTTASFAMLSEMPDYNEKVKLFIAISPVTSVEFVSTGVRHLIPFVNEIAFTLNLFSSGEFSANNELLMFMKKHFCSMGSEEFCQSIVSTVTGVDKSQQSEVTLHMSSTSTKCLVHYAQLLKSKKFRKYDYGFRNMQHYQQKEPPEYNLSRITTPVALIWSTADQIANPKDVDNLRRRLKSLVYDYCVPYPYNHADFFTAEEVPKLIYEPILKLLVQY